MQAWKLTAGLAGGNFIPAAAVDPGVPVVVLQTFETDSTPLTGGWARTTEWAKNGSYSFGRGNKAVPNSASTATFASFLTKQVKMEFDWWVQGEGSDRFFVTINGKRWTLAQSGITDPAQFGNGDVGSVSSPGGIGGHCVLLLDPGDYVINFTFTKDSSIDVGLDGSFIDNFQTTTYPNAIVTPPVGATYFSSFENDAGGFTGAWRQASAWKKDGNLSLGSTNPGLPSTNNDTELSLTLAGADVFTVDFDFYVQCESSDGIWAWINGALWAVGRITPNTPGEVVPYDAGKVRSPTGFQGRYSVTVPAGAFNLKLRYSKDSSGDTGLDRAFVDNVYIRPYVKPTPPGATYFEDFETGVGSFSGDWVINEIWSTSGSKSLGSSKKGVGGSTSTATYSTTLAAASTITFDLMTQGENNYDGVLVTVNGANWGSANFTKTSGGTATWRESIRLTSPDGIQGVARFVVPAGPLTVTVNFIKDSSGDVGLDAGFIDNFAVVPSASPTTGVVSFVAKSATQIKPPGEAINVALPPGVQAGDLLVAMVFNRDVDPVILGWTMVDKITHTDSGITQTMYAYTKTYAPGDGNFAIPGSAGRQGVVISAYRGAGGTPAVIGISKVLAPNLSDTWTIPPITSAGNDQMAVCGGTWILTNNSGAAAVSSPWVLDSDQTVPDSANALRIVAMHQPLGASGTTTGGTFGVAGTGAGFIGFVNILLG